jgi:hypothetical protein
MSDSAITNYLDWVKQHGGSYENILLKDGIVKFHLPESL